MARGNRKRPASPVPSEGPSDVNPRRKSAKSVIKASFPKLRTRSVPNVLSGALVRLNNHQTRAVVEMGFGSLLGINFEELPGRFIYWLVDNFNSLRCELILSDGRSIRVGEKDVEHVLGLPRGGIRVQKKTKSETSQAYVEWQSQFEPNPDDSYSITETEVSENMLEDVEGGIWFRRNFIALVDAQIIGNMQDGYVNAIVMKSLENVDDIPKMNWCEHTLMTLLEIKERWTSTKKKSFNGPLIFLIGLYMDRVVLAIRAFPRVAPCVRSLTTENIRDRNNDEMKRGGYGLGWIDCPIDEAVPVGSRNTQHTPPSINPAVMQPHGEQNIPPVRPPTFVADGVQGIVGSVLAKLATVATEVMDILALLDNAPRELASNPDFGKIQELARKFICFPGDKSGEDTIIGDTIVSESQQMNAFWSNPENIAALEKVEEATRRREEFQKVYEDMPNFSIGLTQDPNVANWIDVLETSRQYSEEHSGHVGVGQGVEGQEDVIGVGTGDDVVGAEEPVEGYATEQTAAATQTRKSTRKQRKTVNLSSPFRLRRVDFAQKMNKIHNAVSKWIFDNAGATRTDVLFRMGDNILTREDLETLRPGEYISGNVIDVWAKMLNEMEESRDANPPPPRFFLTNLVTLYSIASTAQELPEERRWALFSEAFDLEIVDPTPANLQAIEMV